MIKKYFLLSLYFLCAPLLGTVLTLEEAEEIVLKRNPQILALEELAKASREEFHNLVSRWLPRVDVDFEYFHTQDKIVLFPTGTNPLTSLVPQNNFWLGGLDFQQLVISKSLYHEIKAGRYDSERVKLEVLSLKNDMLYEIRTAFWNYVLTKEQLAVQEENIRILTTALEDEQKRKLAGKSSIFQVTQSKVAVFNARTSLYTFQRNYKNARNRIIQLLGIDPTSEESEQIIIDENQFPIERLPFFVEKLELLGLTKDCSDAPAGKFYGGLFSHDETLYWEDLALGFNPEIKIREKEISVHNQRKKQHIGDYYPTIRAFASYRQVIPAPTFSQMRWQWLGGGSLVWTLFDGLGRESRISQEKHRENSAIWTFKRVQDSIVISVQNALTELEEAFYSYFAANESKDLSRLALNEALERLKAGIITPLEYRDSAYNFSQAEHNFNQAAFNLLRSYYGLIRASGVDMERLQRCRK